jgi:hypothetical protein
MKDVFARCPKKMAVPSMHRIMITYLCSHEFILEFGTVANRVFSEFRVFFLIPYIPYSIRNCPKFRGIPDDGIRRIPRNFAEFHYFLCHEIPHNFILVSSSIVKTVSCHFFFSSFDFIS